MLRPSCLGEDSTKPELGDVVGQALEQAEAQLGAVLLATTEHDRDLDLVALLEEPHDVTLLGLVVVRVDLRSELHLLDHDVGLVPSCLTGLLGVLVLELPVVHELADRRPRHGRDLDEIEVGLLGQPQGVLDTDDADGFSVGTDESDLGYPDPVVDAQLGGDVSPPGGGLVLDPDPGTRIEKASASATAEASPTPVLRTGRSPPHCCTGTARGAPRSPVVCTP